MKKITSATVFSDAVGMRLSATYSEIDGTTGRIISDNQRFDRVIIDAEITDAAQSIINYAQSSIDQ
jgi:hypothetical protein